MNFRWNCDRPELRKRPRTRNKKWLFLQKVESIDSRLTKIEEEHIPDLEKVFFDGEYLDARVFIKELFSKATTSIVVVNPYADTSSEDNE